MFRLGCSYKRNITDSSVKPLSTYYNKKIKLETKNTTISNEDVTINHINNN